MANKIQIKRTSVTGRTPNTTNASNTAYIDTGELALNLADGKLFSSNGTVYFEVGSNLQNISIAGNTTTTGIIANGSIGSAGQVLTSNSTGIYWASPSAGSLSNANSVLTSTANGTSFTTGYFSALGDAIQKTYILRGTTTNATETEIFLDGSYRIPVNANTTIFYNIDIVARRTDAIDEAAAFHLKGVADNFSGTTADVGNIFETIVARDDARYSVDARANNSTDTINIYVTGVAAKTIRWVAYVMTVEVSQ